MTCNGITEASEEFTAQTGGFAVLDYKALSSSLVLDHVNFFYSRTVSSSIHFLFASFTALKQWLLSCIALQFPEVRTSSLNSATLLLVIS